MSMQSSSAPPPQQNVSTNVVEAPRDYRAPPNVDDFNPFYIGAIVQARYTKDGKYYEAEIEATQTGQYLVRYLDYESAREWLPLSSLRV